MKTITLLLLCASLLSTSLNVLSFGKPSFEQLDINKDNKVSKKEFMDGTPSFIPAEKIFKELDKNEDDLIDKEEFDKAN